MFGIAVISGRSDRRQVGRLSKRTRDHLWEVALVGLVCAAVSVFVAAQIRLGGSYTTAYLALPVLCVTALPSFTLFDLVARLVPRKRHRQGPFDVTPGVLADFRR